MKKIISFLFVLPPGILLSSRSKKGTNEFRQLTATIGLGDGDAAKSIEDLQFLVFDAGFFR